MIKRQGGRKAPFVIFNISVVIHTKHDTMKKINTFELFKEKVEKLLSKRHGITIGDCTDDDQLKIEFEDGSTPEDFVEYIASKYGLERIDEINM